METNNNIVIVNLDKPRQLRYGHKALKTIKRLTGKSVFGLDLNDLDPDEVEAIVYAGLLSEDKDLKLEVMEDLLDKGDYMGIIEKMGEAFALAFGVDEKNSQAEAVVN